MASGEIDAMEDLIRPDLLWRQYSMWIDLYKFYMDLLIRINIFYYAITGAILSFYLSKAPEPLLKYSLLLPMAISLALVCLFTIGIRLLEHTRREMFSIRDQLGLHTAPEFRVLQIMLGLFGLLFLVVTLGLGVLFLR